MQPAQETPSPFVWVGSSPLQRIVLCSAVLCLLAFLLSAVFPFSLNVAASYLHAEDRWLLSLQCILLLVACVHLGEQKRGLVLPAWGLPVAALGLLVICYAGSKLVLLGYPLSRDEQMAVFDSRVFGSGLLAQPLPPFWQAHAGALNTLYMLPAARPVAWISAYLPVNSAMRALFGLLGDPSLTGPVMVALGAIALWNCVRILWRDDHEAAVVALLLYLCSGQVLITGMTAYAMPAHLTLNLVWLWLFLAGRRGTDLAALLVGFFATGLHEPLFHPLFVAPILFTLVLDRKWTRCALFAAGYAVICLFWLSWPVWMHALVTGPDSRAAARGTDYITRLMMTLSNRDPTSWRDMGANLLRFFAWQHLLLLPLLLAAMPVIRRERLAGALALSTILPLYAMFAILPSQGNGFGYRYLHGLIGPAILLAIYGWRHLAAERRWLRPLLLRATIGTMLVLLPLQAWMGHGLYALFAEIDGRITGSKADYVIVGDRDAPLAFNLISNPPDLSDRPIRLLGDETDAALIRGICKPGVSVAMPTSALLGLIQTYFSLPHSTAADERITSLSPRLTAAGCTVARLDAP